MHLASAKHDKFVEKIESNRSSQLLLVMWANWVKIKFKYDLRSFRSGVQLCLILAFCVFKS